MLYTLGMPCLHEWLTVLHRWWSLPPAASSEPRALPTVHSVMPFECPLCFEMQHTAVHCPHCVYQWCLSCEQTWRKQNDSCPYCRVFIRKAHENRPRLLPQISYDDVYPDPLIFLMETPQLHVE
jgi:hypothetical protein